MFGFQEFPTTTTDTSNNNTKNKTIQALKLLYTSPYNSIVEIHG